MRLSTPLPLLALLTLAACAGRVPAPRPLPGYIKTLGYRMELDAALTRGQLTLAATLHGMFSHPVEVASVQVVEGGIWVTPRDSSVQAELLPALKQAMGSAYQVHPTRGESLLVRRTAPARQRASRELVRQTVAAVRERLAPAAPGCKVTTHSGQLRVHLTSVRHARAVRQLLAQPGRLSLHLLEPRPPASGARAGFRHLRAGSHLLQRQPLLDAGLLDGARLQRDDGGSTVLTLLLTPAGKERLAEVSAAYGGRKLAVLLDGSVLAVTTLTDPPADPSAIPAHLPGSPSEAKQERLSRVLQSALLHGPLPVRLREVR